MNKQMNKHIYATKSDLASDLADNIVTQLGKAIEASGKATIAVSGGSTPKLLFKELSSRDIEWEKVSIVLVDERYVAPDDNRSNEKLVRTNLMQGPASSANFTGFWIDGKTVIQAKSVLDNKIRDLGPLDIVVLGMGLDGHTASFFPGGNNLSIAMDPLSSYHIMDMEAAGAGEPRLTITMPVIINAKNVILHIEGEDKHQKLDQAIDKDTPEILPICSVITALPKPIELYWAP